MDLCYNKPVENTKLISLGQFRGTAEKGRSYEIFICIRFI